MIDLKMLCLSKRFPGSLTILPHSFVDHARLTNICMYSAKVTEPLPDPLRPLRRLVLTHTGLRPVRSRHALRILSTRRQRKSG